MKLIYRLAYYLGGFTIGLILLFFFLSGKKTSCDYGPNARVLKNIRSKEKVLAPEVQQKLSDTAAITELLNYGEVNFGASNTSLDSCKVYVIEGKYQQEELQISVKNCDNQAFIHSLKTLKE